MTFTFGVQAAVNVALVYYADAAGTVPRTVADGGTATLTVTRDSSLFEGERLDPIRANLPTMAIDGGTSAATPAATWKAVGLGEGMGSINLQASSLVIPGVGAMSYRLLHDGVDKS